MKSTSFRLTDGVHAALVRLAKAEHRSLSGMLTVLILQAAKKAKGVTKNA